MRQRYSAGPFIISFKWQSFALAAMGADEDCRRFTGLFLELGHEPQPIRAARRTPHFEFAKRTVSGCLRWLVIFSTLKIARGIHPGSLHRGWDIDGPSG
jgi:hypothetical protein